MSDDCDFGISRMPIHSETRIGGIHCPEKCRSLKFLEPGHYYPANTPLVKVASADSATGRAYYRKWAPGDTRIDGIRMCDADATNWPAEGCQVYICIAAKQVPSPLLCWPVGTTAADINAVLDEEGCCITLQGVPCLPFDTLPCVPQTGGKVHAGGTQTTQSTDETGTGDQMETGGETATEQKQATAPAFASTVPGATVHAAPTTPAERAKQAAIAASVLSARELAIEQANMARAMRSGSPA